MASIKKSRFTVILIAATGVAIVSGILFFLWNSSPFRRDLRCFSKNSYDSVFLSMHSTSNYSQEDFATYHGLNTLISSYEIQSLKEQIGRAHV